jgi:hypothetical protein
MTATWVIARDLDDEPRTVYWRGVDTCGNLAWGGLAPVAWPTRAGARRAYGLACGEVRRARGAAGWIPPETRAAKLTTEQAALT